jgi:hypothetical protein
MRASPWGTARGRWACAWGVLGACWGLERPGRAGAGRTTSRGPGAGIQTPGSGSGLLAELGAPGPPLWQVFIFHLGAEAASGGRHVHAAQVLQCPRVAELEQEGEGAAPLLAAPDLCTQGQPSGRPWGAPS